MSKRQKAFSRLIFQPLQKAKWMLESYGIFED
jgi:hypothetical protein